MKSLCIKDNNEDVLNFIYNRLLKLDLSSLFVSRHSFRMYKNIIVHFNGDDLSLFYDKLAINLSKAFCPSSVRLYTPASSSTCINTSPISFLRIS